MRQIFRVVWKGKTIPDSFHEENQFHGRLKGTCFYQSTLAGWKGKSYYKRSYGIEDRKANENDLFNKDK